MSQNSVRQYATFAVLDEQLKTIMKNIHDDCFNHGELRHFIILKNPSLTLINKKLRYCDGVFY